MKLLQKIVGLCVLLAAATFGVNAHAADATSVDRTLKGDAVCTRCHDEGSDKAILSVYKTRHGNKADERSPGCQSCHGSSTNHLKDKAQSPDVVFGKGKTASDASVQNTTCISCHQAGKRSHWEGSQHQGQGMACTSCHTNHNGGNDKVLNKATQPEVCFTCHKTERAQTHRISTHPIAAGKMACSDCHNPHGSTGPKLLVKTASTRPAIPAMLKNAAHSCGSIAR